MRPAGRFVVVLGTAAATRTMAGVRGQITAINSAITATSFAANPHLYIGNVWERRAEMSIQQLLQGAGAGIVWDTPVGPAQFSVAKPFAFENDDVRNNAKIDFSSTVFYFSLGHDF